MTVARTTVAERKAMPIASGVLDYFPDALLVVAEVSRIGNEQHHPGEPLHWDKSKSTDEADALLRHLIDRGTLDSDGVRHTAKVAWRALALLQRELDAEAAVTGDALKAARLVPVLTAEAHQKQLGDWVARAYGEYVANERPFPPCTECNARNGDHFIACPRYEDGA